MATVDLGKVRITFEGSYDSSKDYELLSVVENAYGIKYISVQDAPAGTALSDADYWKPISGKFVEQYQGASDTEPSKRLDGTDLQIGDLFFNTDKKELQVVVDSSGNWIDYANAYTKSTVDSKILKTSVMTKAEFEALAEARRKQYAGSGFVEWGDANNYIGYYNVINNSTMKVRSPSFLDNRFSNRILLFREGNAKVNINGDNIILNGTGLDNGGFGTIDLPQSPLAFNVTDSTTLPQAMKQGDFAVLADLDRELVTNGTFDSNINGWVAYYSNHYASSVSYDSSNNRLKCHQDTNPDYIYGALTQTNFPLLKGVKYKLTFDIFDDGNHTIDGEIFIRTNGNNSIGLDNISIKPILNGNTVTYEFVSPISDSNAELLIRGYALPDTDNGEDFYVDNVSIKQVEESPIVALQDVDANIDIYANASNFEGRDSVSAQHLAFLEVWEESITDKDFAYPFGNTQYRGGDIDGLTGITEGTFEGADTYSLFSDSWQQPGDLVGKGYVWSNLSDTDKVKLASNPDNNIYKDGDNWVQVRYRVRVEKTTGNINADDYMAKNLGYTYEGLGLWQS